MSNSVIESLLVVPILFGIGLFYVHVLRLLVRSVRWLVRRVVRPAVGKTPLPAGGDGFPPYQP